MKEINVGKMIILKRKEKKITQDELAKYIGVSKAAISKWETGETIPDIRQCKRLAVLYQMSLDGLIDFDINTAEIQEMIKKSGEKADEKINWTNEWGKKYPILLTYQGKVNIPNYAYRIKTMLDELEQEYKFNAQDAMLVFKDILYNVWKERSGSR